MREIRHQIEILSSELRIELEPLRIILHGAYAYESEDETVDKDPEVEILVILQAEKQDYEKATAIRKLYEKDFPLNLMIGTPAQIARRVARDDAWLRGVLENGEILYEHPQFPRVIEEVLSGL